MISSDIIKKIEALLNLAGNNTSAAEAALAAGRAQALLEKYQLTMADLDAAKEEKPTEAADPLTTERNGWKPILCDAVVKANQCHGFTSSRGYVVVGKPSNVQIVNYFYAYLEREIMRLCKQAVINGQTEDIDGIGIDGPSISNDAASKRSFCMGAAAEVGKRLREAREATRAQAHAEGSTAIVKLDNETAALKRWCTQMYNLQPRLTRGPSKRDAYASGISAGKGIALNKGLEGKRGRLLGR